ncbi:hypothetical protein WAI453_003663 [Rhynchosporium graminicola]
MTSSPRALQRSHPRPIRVLITLFPDFNTFDANGPIEVLSQANGNSSSSMFIITIASSNPLTRSIENISIARDISLRDALARVEEWDIVLLPGGAWEEISKMLNLHWERKEESGFVEFLDQYADKKDGLILTVCTGSLFLAGLRKLDGRIATTHWAYLPTQKKLCADNNSTTKVVRARWVDSDEEGLPRLITAGGVACGIDATFHLLEMIAGPELVEKVARAIDYQRREEELQEDYVIPTL